jgi:hypothetical protein
MKWAASALPCGTFPSAPSRTGRDPFGVIRLSGSSDVGLRSSDMDLSITGPFHSLASFGATCLASPCTGLRFHRRRLLPRLCRHRLAPLGDPAFRHPCTYRARFRSPTHPLVPVPLTGIHTAEVAIICRPYDGTAWHRSSRWEATYSIRELGFNQFRLNHSRGSCSALSPRYRHALVPSVFRLRVSR